VSKRYNAELYLRLSVEDAVNTAKRGKINPFQDQSESIENQRALLSEYADLQGWNVTNVYADDGFSGGQFDNRPAFQRMVRDAEAGIIDLILCKDLSRLGRDYIETGRYTEEVFPSLGVRFVALMDNIDSEGDADLLPFRAIMNYYHLRDLSRKVKSVMRAKAEKGEYIGSCAPYGFVKDPDNRNRLLIDEPTAAAVRQVFDLRRQGLGCYKIAAALNNDGIPSPRTYMSRRDGAESPAKAWIACVISRMLENEAYIGHAVRFKTGCLSYKNRKTLHKPKDEWIRCENAFPPIVTLEIWNAAQSVRVEHRREFESKPKPANSLFCGLLRCADCGGAMIIQSAAYTSRQTKEQVKHKSYVCGKYANSCGSACSRHGISEKDLLSIIREDVATRLKRVVIDEAGIDKEICKRMNSKSTDETRERLEQLATRVSELESVGVKLYEDRLKGVISVDTFAALYEKAEAERDDDDAEHERISGLLADAERFAANARGTIPLMREFFSLEKVTRETLTALIDHIIVSESVGRGKRRKHEVRIVYRFG
jgi:DNA invertase Pin-like site-specific DNA recombinase